MRPSPHVVFGMFKFDVIVSVPMRYLFGLRSLVVEFFDTGRALQPYLMGPC